MNARMMLIALIVSISCQNEIFGASSFQSKTRTERFLSLADKDSLKLMTTEELETYNSERREDTAICLGGLAGGAALWVYCPQLAASIKGAAFLSKIALIGMKAVSGSTMLLSAVQGSEKLDNAALFEEAMNSKK